MRKEGLSVIVFMMPSGEFIFLRFHGSISQLPIPKTSVVCTNIANGVKTLQPAHEEFVRQAKVLGHFPLNLVLGAFEKGQETAHAHKLAHHPDRKIPMLIAIFLFEVRFEGLLAPTGFGKEVFSKTDVLLHFQFGQILF
jgi:hypothetical protein